MLFVLPWSIARTKVGNGEVGKGALAWVDVKLQRWGEGCSGADSGKDARLSTM